VILQAIANVYRRQGRLEDAIQILEGVTELDPQDWELWHGLAFSYRAMRQTDKTLAAQDRVIELTPAADWVYAWKAGYVADLTGDLGIARAITEQLPRNNRDGVMEGWRTQYYRERNWADAIEILQTWEPHARNQIAFRDSWIANYMFWRDDLEAARPAIKKAMQTVAEAIETSPESLSLRKMSSRLNAVLGDEATALREANTAVELTAHDAFSAPNAEEHLAFIYSTLGRTKDALDILEYLLETNYEDSITVHRLQFEAAWDPLRDHPRFQALLEKYGQEAG